MSALPPGAAAAVATPDLFAALGVPRRHDLDPAELEARYREGARVHHPDRWARAAPEERRRAAERATLLNQAYRTLRDPRRRAEHLLALAGAPAAPAPGAGFLEAQLALREALAAARAAGDAEALARHAARLRGELQALDAELARALAGAAPMPAALAAAAGLTARARFLESALREAEGEAR